MGFFRSNKVLHLRIRMPNDIEGLMRIMDILGKTEIEALQFIDLTKEVPDSKKNFSSILKRVEQMETKTTQFMNYASEFQIKVYLYKSYDKFIEDIESDLHLKDLSLSTYFDFIETEVIENERRILELIESRITSKNERRFGNRIRKKISF